MNATAGAKYLKGSTKTGKALKYTKTELFDKSSRKGVPKVLIVLTDGKNAHLIVHNYYLYIVLKIRETNRPLPISPGPPGRFPKTLTFKMRPRAQPYLWK